MMRIQKLARLGQPVPLLAAFPFSISLDGSAFAAPSSVDRCNEGRRDYSTCVEEESVGIISSKNDVKRDD